MEIEVDQEKCQAHQICVFVAPELFEAGPDDKARVKQNPVPADQEFAAEEAVANCPVGAISITASHQ